MENKENILKILFLIIVVTTVIWLIIYLQNKSGSNYVKPVKPLTVEDKLRFKGGLSE